MKSGTKIIKDLTPQFAKNVSKLTTKRVLVGIPEEKSHRDDPKDLIGNAALGYIHDKGSPAQNIPARPWLEAGVQTVMPDILERLKKVGADALEGKDVDGGLTAIGLVAQNAVRRKITEGPFVPLAPSTLAKRRAKGRQGTRPLIDTAQMRAAVTFVIRSVKK